MTRCSNTCCLIFDATPSNPQALTFWTSCRYLCCSATLKCFSTNLCASNHWLMRRFQHFLLIRLNPSPSLDRFFHLLPAQSIRTGCWFDPTFSLKKIPLNSSCCCFHYQRLGCPSSCSQLSSFTFLQSVTYALSTVQSLPCRCIYWWEPLPWYSLQVFCSRKGLWNRPEAFRFWF